MEKATTRTIHIGTLNTQGISTKLLEVTMEIEKNTRLVNLSETKKKDKEVKLRGYIYIYIVEIKRKKSKKRDLNNDQEHT